jgi:hypothetical protein
VDDAMDDGQANAAAFTELSGGKIWGKTKRGTKRLWKNFTIQYDLHGKNSNNNKMD